MYRLGKALPTEMNGNDLSDGKMKEDEQPSVYHAGSDSNIGDAEILF